MNRAIAVLILICVPLLAPAQDRAGQIEETISGQIDAFLADDFTTAFEFASPSIRRIFRTPENFGAMVRQGYPMVWRPSDVRFLELRNEGGRVIQRVLVRDGSGAFHALDYQMVATENGWLINGVWLLPSPGSGV